MRRFLSWLYRRCIPDDAFGWAEKPTAPVTLPPVKTPETRHSLDYWESAIIPGQD